jgi:hypothetical protein
VEAAAVAIAGVGVASDIAAAIGVLILPLPPLARAVQDVCRDVIHPFV